MGLEDTEWEARSEAPPQNLRHIIVIRNTSKPKTVQSCMYTTALVCIQTVADSRPMLDNVLIEKGNLKLLAYFYCIVLCLKVENWRNRAVLFTQATFAFRS